MLSLATMDLGQKRGTTRIRPTEGLSIDAAFRVLVRDAHCDAAVTIKQSVGRAGALVTVAARDTSALACRSRIVAHVLRQPGAPLRVTEWLTRMVSAKDFDLMLWLAGRGFRAGARLSGTNRDEHTVLRWTAEGMLNA